MNSTKCSYMLCKPIAPPLLRRYNKQCQPAEAASIQRIRAASHTNTRNGRYFVGAGLLAPVTE